MKFLALVFVFFVRHGDKPCFVGYLAARPRADRMAIFAGRCVSLWPRKRSGGNFHPNLAFRNSIGITRNKRVRGPRRNSGSLEVATDHKSIASLKRFYNESLEIINTSEKGGC
jgi:hypothetical protein